MGGLANTKQVQRKRKSKHTDEFGLTALERKFADTVLKNPEMTQASCYLKAGYNEPKTRKLLHKYASKTIKRPHVQAYLEMRRKQLAKKVNVQQGDVVQELYNIGFFDPADLFTEDGCLKQITEIPEGARKAISQIDVFTEYDGRGENREAIGQTTRIKFVDKKGALDSLARYLGMFKQDQIDTDGIAELMGLVAQARGGSTIGRLNSIEAEGPVQRPALEASQSVLDPGQGGQRGPLPSQLGANGVAPKLLVHERHPESETAGDDDVHRHPPSR
jgi:phage terminase small subunit